MTGTPEGAGHRPARQFRRSRGRTIGDAVISRFVLLGLIPSTYLLTTTGRTTGRDVTHPATVVENDGRLWLVAPYGVVSWVRNVRADGGVTLSRLSRRRRYTVREVSAVEAGPVLKEYVRVASATRPYFRATLHDDVAAFVAEADEHPVYELTPA